MLSSLTQHLRRIFGKQAAIMVETVRITFELYNICKCPFSSCFGTYIKKNKFTNTCRVYRVRSFRRDSKNRLFSPPRSFHNTIWVMCDACDEKGLNTPLPLRSNTLVCK